MGVAFLASSQCDFSGVILQTGDGHFAFASWQRSAGIDFSGVDIAPEDIAEQWGKIMGEAAQ